MKVIGLMNEIYNGNTDLPNKIKVDNVIFHKDYVGDTIEYYNYNNNSNPDGILMQDYFKESYNTKAFLKLEVEEVKEEVRWKPKKGERYYFVDLDGKIFSYTCDNDNTDNYMYDINNQFKTEEEAKKHLENIQTEIELRKLAKKLNKGQKIDWSDEDQEKYYIEFNYNNKSIEINWESENKLAKTIYCLDDEFRDKAIEQIGKERLKNYLMED